MNCPECDGSDLTIQALVSPNPNGGIPDGRLRIHDLHVDLVVGCEECSATVLQMRADSPEGVALLTAGLKVAMTAGTANVEGPATRQRQRGLSKQVGFLAAGAAAARLYGREDLAVQLDDLSGQVHEEWRRIEEELQK